MPYLYPEWADSALYQDLEHTGPEEYGVSNLKESFCPRPKCGGFVDGGKALFYLQFAGILDRSLCLLDLHAIQLRGMEFFFKYFEDNRLIAWKSVVRKDKDYCLWMPYLEKRNEKISICWGSLDSQFDLKTPIFHFK